MQHLKNLLKEKREELPLYESNACINQFRYRLLKVIEVAGKHILKFFLDLLLNEMCDCCLSWHVQVIGLSLLNHKKMSFALDIVQ